MLAQQRYSLVEERRTRTRKVAGLILDGRIHVTRVNFRCWLSLISVFVTPPCYRSGTLKTTTPPPGYSIKSAGDR